MPWPEMKQSNAERHQSNTEVQAAAITTLRKRKAPSASGKRKRPPPFITSSNGITLSYIANQPLYIGTSGYSYSNWHAPPAGHFYPAKCRPSQELEYYFMHFQCNP